MKKMKASSYPVAPVDVVRHQEAKLPGHAQLVQGIEISIKAERGRFRFHEFVEGPTGSWLTVWGPVSGDGQRAQWRSFDPGRIRTVHRISKARS